MIWLFGKVKCVICGDDDDGDVCVSCDVVMLFVFECMFYSLFNFFGVMMLMGVGLMVVGCGGKVLIVFGVIIYGFCILVVIEFVVLYWRCVDVCRRVDFDGDLRVDDSRLIVVLYVVLVLFMCLVDLVYVIVYFLFDCM